MQRKPAVQGTSPLMQIGTALRVENGLQARLLFSIVMSTHRNFTQNCIEHADCSVLADIP